MTTLLLVLFFGTLMMLLLEESIMSILLYVEMSVLSLLFLVLEFNVESFPLMGNLLILLTLVVSESALGLGLLMNIVRLYGTDKVTFTSMSK